MGKALFYHLTESTLEETIPRLLYRAISLNWRVFIRGKSAECLDWLDRRMWITEDFLPHGRSGGPFDALQPVMLGQEGEDCQSYQGIIAIDGSNVSADEVVAAERVWIVFDSQTAEELATARTQWKSLTDQGCEAEYWGQEDGRWKLKAATSPSGAQ